jgi:hypothetical protein
LPTVKIDNLVYVKQEIKITVFSKFFGKKNDGFYLQLEDDTPKTPPAAKAPAQDAAKSEPVATPVAVPAVTTPSAGTAPAAVETGTAEVAKIDKKLAKAEEKAAKMAKKAAAKADSPKVEKTVAPVATPVPAAPAITNFATDYLIKPSSISGRRRPGANMNQFLELARQVEKPKSFKAAEKK